MTIGNPGTWLHGQDLEGDATPPERHDGCGCSLPLVWDAKRGYWRHLVDGTPCRTQPHAEAA